MRGIVLFVAALLAVAQPAAQAQASSERRMLAAKEASDFRGVGRVNIGGTRFCTGTLISDRLVLTAAHCLYNPRTLRRVPTSAIRFVAGLRLGAHAASRRVVRAAVTPGYRFDGHASLARIETDVALLELERPVEPTTATAFPVVSGEWRGGGMTLVSYARDRAHAPSIQEDCAVRTSFGKVAALDCEAQHGASGSPVFAQTAEGLRVVGVVSAMGRKTSDGPTALVVKAVPTLATLQAALREEPFPVKDRRLASPALDEGRFAQSR